MLPLRGSGTLCIQVSQEKSKGEHFDSKATPTKVEKEVETNDDCAISAHAPLEKRWGDIEL